MVQRRVGVGLLLVLAILIVTAQRLPSTLAAQRSQARPTVPAGRPTVAATARPTSKPPEPPTQAAPTVTSVAAPTSAATAETATFPVAATPEVPTVVAVPRALPRTGSVAEPLSILYLALAAGSLAIGALLAISAWACGTAEE
jgi:hypothetical protein